jgi:hypothetical protein
VAIEAPEEGPDLRDAALAAFERWRRALAGALEGGGVAGERADELAVMVIAASEGALIMSRACRDLGPLENVQRELHQQLTEELDGVRGAT